MTSEDPKSLNIAWKCRKMQKNNFLVAQRQITNPFDYKNGGWTHQYFFFQKRTPILLIFRPFCKPGLQKNSLGSPEAIPGLFIHGCLGVATAPGDLTACWGREGEGGSRPANTPENPKIFKSAIWSTKAHCDLLDSFCPLTPVGEVFWRAIAPPKKTWPTSSNGDLSSSIVNVLPSHIALTVWVPIPSGEGSAQRANDLGRFAWGFAGSKSATRILPQTPHLAKIWRCTTIGNVPNATPAMPCSEIPRLNLHYLPPTICPSVKKAKKSGSEISISACSGHSVAKEKWLNLEFVVRIK